MSDEMARESVWRMRRPGTHVREEEGDDDVAWEAESRLSKKRRTRPVTGPTGLQTPETARGGNGKWQPVVSVAN